MAWTINNGKLYFNSVLYTGNAGTQSITGVGFQPDFCWNKNRSAATSNQLFDAVRGATKRIYSDSTSAENTNTNILNRYERSLPGIVNLFNDPTEYARVIKNQLSYV